MRVYRRCPGDVCRHGHGDGCRAVRDGYYRLCELTDPGHPDYRPEYLEALAGEPAGTPTPPPSFDPAAHRAVLACKVRQSPKGCGCQGSQAKLCFRGGFPVPTSYENCLACVARGRA